MFNLDSKKLYWHYHPKLMPKDMAAYILPNINLAGVNARDRTKGTEHYEREKFIDHLY